MLECCVRRAVLTINNALLQQVFEENRFEENWCTTVLRTTFLRTNFLLEENGKVLLYLTITIMN